MKHILLALILVLPLMLLGAERDQSAQAARLRKFTKTSTVAHAAQDDVQANGFLITEVGTPFTFPGVDKVTKIAKIAITVTLAGGGTQAGDPEQGALTLALDGIDTGLLLDGLPQADTGTVTISGIPNNEAEIRARLQRDGKLSATIIDATPGDNGMSASSADNTTLVIKGKRRR
jgi:hypothetical protein